MRRMYGIPYAYLHEWLDFCMANVGTSFFQVTRIDHPNGDPFFNIQKGREQKNLVRVVGVDSARFMLFKTTKNTKPWKKWWIQLNFKEKNSWPSPRCKIPRGLNLNRWSAMKYYCISSWLQLKYFLIFTPIPWGDDPT